MSRTVKTIYNEILTERNKRLELSEFNSDSKLSVMNGIAYITAVAIYSCETIMDVLAIDITNTINSRINGTPQFYAKALLQYQKGDDLTVRDDGLAFGYATIDETKRIVTQVSYLEVTDNVLLDNKLVLKVATGERGSLSKIPEEDLTLIKAYMAKIKFAGTRIEVTSRSGDVLIPRVSVYYDGAILEDEMYSLIEESLNNYLMNIDFDANIYVSKVLDAIKSTKHVIDVYIDPTLTPEQGIYLACYDADDRLEPVKKIERISETVSGYIKESSGTGEEVDIPNFRQSIKLIVAHR